MNVRIADPYAAPGEYRKVQLHCHTTSSDGRFRPAELLRMYKRAGYAFVFITDHNRVTRCRELDDETFLALPGTEDTVSRLRPFGPHLLRLFVDQSLIGGDAQHYIDRTDAVGGVTGLCHPSWTGNLWTGAWPLDSITRLRGYHLIEIANPHTDPARDVLRWEAALRRRGAPVWGVAVDDCHHGTQFNRAWIMARVEAMSAGALRAALRAGRFYASTGPAARFGVRDGVIVAQMEDAMTVRFIDGSGRVRLEREGTDGGYAVRGDEQYIRVEARRGPYAVWSQPFVIGEEADRAEPAQERRCGSPGHRA